MTFAVFIIFCLGLLIGILNVLPVAGQFPLDLANSVTLIIGYMREFNFILPVAESLYCLGIVIAYEITIWVMHVLFRVYRAIRGTNSGN